MDFPTATDPAMPMTNVVVVSGSFSSWLDATPSSFAARHVEAEEPAEREVDLAHLVDVEFVAEAADLCDFGIRQRLRHLRCETRPIGAVDLAIERWLSDRHVDAFRHAGCLCAEPVFSSATT